MCHIYIPKIRVFDRLTLQAECLEKSTYLFPLSFSIPGKATNEILGAVFFSARKNGSLCYYDVLFFSSKSSFAMALVTFWLGFIAVHTIAKTVSKCFFGDKSAERWVTTYSD